MLVKKTRKSRKSAENKEDACHEENWQQKVCWNMDFIPKKTSKDGILKKNGII